MPQFNRRELDTRAREYGFNRDTFEKVLRLRKILEFLNTHEYMREHLLLKGGDCEMDVPFTSGDQNKTLGRTSVEPVILFGHCT